MEKDFNDVALIKKNIKSSKENYICLNCFDTRERKIKRKDILREPKRTWLYQECDNCCYNKKGFCNASPVGDMLYGRDYDYIPVTHRCQIGRTDDRGDIISMSELACPMCKRLIHKVIGENIIISIVQEIPEKVIILACCYMN